MSAQQVTSVIDGNPIWANKGLQNGPILRPAHQQRIVLCGWPGSGKSTFLLSIPRCLILDSERGSDELPTVHPTTFRRTITRWEEVEETLESLERDRKINGDQAVFQVVGLDSMDGLGGSQNSTVAEYVMRDSKADVVAAFGANGSGWSRVNELAARMLLRIEAAGYGWVATTHLRWKQFPTARGTISKIQRDLTPRVDAFVGNRASYVAVLEKTISQTVTKKSVVVQGKTIEMDTGQMQQTAVHRVMFTSVTSGAEELCKARLLRGQDFEFDVTNGWSEWVRRYDDAAAALTKAAAQKSAA